MEPTAYLTDLVEYAETIIYAIVGVTFFSVFTVLFLQVLRRWQLNHRNMKWLEITPPAQIAKTPDATKQLFSVIHGLRSSRTLKQRIMRITPTFSFEIISTKREGVRYLLQVDEDNCATVQKAVIAYIPDATAETISAKIMTVMTRPINALMPSAKNANQMPGFLPYEARI